MLSRNSQPEANARDLRAAKRAQNRLDSEVLIPKRRKIAAVALQLVDINYDCLRRIFEFLDVNDLINVAEADDNFIAAATDVFLQRLRKATSKISVESDIFATCLSHFGHISPGISVGFGQIHDSEWQKNIEKYCRKSLHHLNVHNLNENHFERIQKPFINVRKLVISESTLGRKMSQMNLWFPNLVCLNLYDVNLTQPKFMEVNLPKLKHLTIGDARNLPYPPLLKMLRFNPQLKSLSLTCHYDAQLLQSISEHLVQLAELELCVPNDRFVSFGNKKSLFTTVKKFTLNDWSPSQLIYCLPFEFKGLEELVINGLNQSRGLLLKLICECQQLIKLKIYPSVHVSMHNSLSIDDFTLIFQQLSKLNKVKLRASYFNQAALTQLLTNVPNIKHVQLLFPCSPYWSWSWWMDDDWAEIGSEWVMERTFIQDKHFLCRLHANCVRLRLRHK